MEPSDQPEEKKLKLLKVLGPGLVTGASDDDPSGIATYSQVGAQFGLGMLWTMLFSYPLMAGIQEIAGTIGRTSGRGISGNMRRHYPRFLLYLAVFLVVVANVINLGADIGAMGGAASILIGGNALIYATGFALLSILLQVFVPYHRYVSVLKWLTLALFAYVAVLFVVHVDWPAALHATVLPGITLDADHLVALVAVLGTTISPYLFFWQASEEVEELNLAPKEEPLRRAPSQAAYQLKRLRFDTYIGMFFSNGVAFCIILAAAVTLNRSGLTDIQTATQSALALKPIAGQFAFLLFAAGIIGTGLLAVPVLAGSAGYALGEALNWPVGLERSPLHAKGFYGVLTAAILIGLGMTLLHVDPIKALFWSAVVNGVAAGPIMVMMMFLACNPAVMGEFTISRRLRITGWLATVVMLGSAVLMFVFWGR